VFGMTCDACERHVAEAIRAAGGGDPDVSWRAGTATFSGRVDEAELRGSIAEAGYELQSLRRSAPLEVVASDGEPSAGCAGATPTVRPSSWSAWTPQTRVVLVNSLTLSRTRSIVQSCRRRDPPMERGFSASTVCR